MSKIDVPNELLEQIKNKAFEEHGVKLDVFRLDHLVRLYVCHFGGKNYKIFINMNHKPVLYVQGGNYGTCRDYKEQYKPIEDLARNIWHAFYKDDK